MQLMRLLTVAGAALLMSIPCRSDAGGPADRVGMGRAGGFRTQNFVSSPALSRSAPFRFHNRSVLYPFISQGYDEVYTAPPQVFVVPVPVQQVSREAPVAVPDPKFISAPTQSPPSQPGSHTVIVQRGSQIEVQTFPAAR